MRSGSSQASSTWAAEPARIVSCEPTGMVSRRPEGRSAAATQTRCSPWRRHSWADSPVMSRSRASTGPGGGQQAVLAGGRGQLGQARARARSGPACRGRRGGGARGRRRGGGRSGGPARCRRRGPARVAGPDSRAREHEGGLVEHADAARCCPYANTAVSDIGTQDVAWPVSHRGRARIAGTRRESRAMGRTLAEKVWDEHVVRSADGRARPALHRPPPHPRGDLAAGLRRPAPRRPHGTPPRPDPGHRGPQRARRSTGTSRSPTRSPARRSRRCARTPRSSASACTRSATSSRASSTSSARSSA